MKALIMATDREEKRIDGVKHAGSFMDIYEKRHLIQYSLDAAVESGVEEILIAAGTAAEEIINGFGIMYRDIRIKYVLVKEHHGFIDALIKVREALEYEDFIVFRGNEIVLDPHPQEMIENFYEQDLFIGCGVVPASCAKEGVHGYGIMYDPYDYRIYRIIDNPRRPISAFTGTGIYVFRNEIVEYLEPLYAEEQENPDGQKGGPAMGPAVLVQFAIDDGYRVKLYAVGSSVVETVGENRGDSVLQEEVEEQEWKVEFEPVF
jgi:dTDP-glucose pyrophosphorylase